MLKNVTKKGAKNMQKNRFLRTIAVVLLAAIMVTPQSVMAAPKIITCEQGEVTTINIVHDTLDKTKMDKVPLFNQVDYPNHPYGNYGSIASHGCGIVSVTMVLSYLKDTVYSPVDMAKEFGHYNTEHGSYWSLMTDAFVKYGIEAPMQTRSTKTLVEKLKEGHVAISIQHEGLFTGGGHYIVLAGITEDGKIIVNDPNGGNWQKNAEMIEGFTNGFTPEQVDASNSLYWIYPLKENNP